MTLPSLLKRLEALESVQNPQAPLFLWQPYRASLEAHAAFEAELAAMKAANPGSSIMVIGWEDPA